MGRSDIIIAKNVIKLKVINTRKIIKNVWIQESASEKWKKQKDNCQTLNGLVLYIYLMFLLNFHIPFSDMYRRTGCFNKHGKLI